MHSQVAIKIFNLNLLRNKNQVLDDVSMQIFPAEIVCLLGPSASGKTSLLRCINRLTEPPSTTIFYEGKDITQIDTLILRREIGMVFQEVSLFEGNIASNISYGPGLKKQSLTRQEIIDLLSMADLPANLIDHNSQELSGGQAQRVAIARALATRPRVLLLDEPTSALDPNATRNIEETILKLRTKLDLTVIWVTHNPQQAKRVADRIYLLVDGHIEDEGSPEHLLREGSKHLTAVFASGELEGAQS